jgi:hypothetical protein
MLLREQLVLPALADLHAWLLVNQRTLATGSGTAKAIDHARKRLSALQRYVTSGSLPIDNNPVENALSPIAICKKNWLFAGSERTGRRAAAIQSLLATAKLNDLDPARWLADTPEKLPTCPNSQIDLLLPFANSTKSKQRRKVGPLAAYGNSPSRRKNTAGTGVRNSRQRQSI